VDFVRTHVPEIRSSWLSQAGIAEYQPAKLTVVETVVKPRKARLSKEEDA
jgi:hypothetical protein